jgi:hypothetical protein
MAIGIKVGVNTVPGGKKCMPGAATKATVAVAPRNLNTVALEARLRALGHRARESLEANGEDTSRGTHTRPDGKKDFVAQVTDFFKRLFRARPPIHPAPKPPPSVPLNTGVYHPGSSTTIEVGINTTPGGKKNTGSVLV